MKNEYTVVLVFKGDLKKIQCASLDEAQNIADKLKPNSFYVTGINHKRRKKQDVIGKFQKAT